MLEAPDPLSPATLQGAEQLERELARFRTSRRTACSPCFVARSRQRSISRRGRRAAAHVRHRHVAVPSSRAFGRSLLRHRARAARQFPGRARPCAGRNRRARVAARWRRRALLHRRPARRRTVARRLARAANRRGHQEVHAAVRHFPDDAGGHGLSLLAHVGRDHSHAGRRVAMAVGLGDVFGWTNKLVSTLVPLTVMVTTTATLVYIHSRYMEPRRFADACSSITRGRSPINSCRAPPRYSRPRSASRALAVSDIRPVREMGLWTACGLIVAWVGCFTLFPALQSLLRTPVLPSSPRSVAVFRALRRHADPGDPPLPLAAGRPAPCC